MRKLLAATTVAALVLLMGFSPQPAQGASSPVSIDITPFGTAFGPLDKVHIHIHIERDKRNRAAAMIFSSADYFTESDFELNGEAAPTMFDFTVRALTGGTFQAFVVVVGEGGKQLNSAKSQTLTIIPPL